METGRERERDCACGVTHCPDVSYIGSRKRNNDLVFYN